MKVILLSVLAALGIALSALIWLTGFATGPQLKPIAAWGASKALGRTVSIGDLDIERGSTSTFRLADVVVENAPWSGPEPLAQVGALTLSVDTWTVLSATPDIHLIEVIDAVMRPTLHADGRSNWSNVSVSETVPDTRGESPILRDLSLSNVQVYYGVANDEGVDVLEEVKIDAGSGTAAPGEPVGLTAEGSYREQPLTVKVSGAPFADLVARAQDYSFSMAVNGAVDATLSGVLSSDGDLDDLELSLSGATLSDLAPFLPGPVPETPPFSVTGQIEFETNYYGFNNLAGSIGDSDLAGELAFDLNGDRPFVTGTLRSNLLDFDDLAGLIGAEPDPSETANDEQRAQADDQPLLPDATVPTVQLRQADMALSYVADKVSSPIAQVESVDAVVKLTDGRLLVTLVKMGVSEGLVDGEIALNAREEIPSADIDLRFEDISFSKFFARSEFAQEMGGAINGKMYFLGVGETLADMVASVRGDGHLIVRDGKISALLLEGAGVDVAEALGVLLTGDSAVAMACAVGAVSAEAGVLTIREGIASTRDSNVIANGEVNLANQTVGLQVEARAKDFSLLDLDVPIYVKGPLNAPSVSLGGGNPLPFFEFGDGENVSCDGLEARAREIAPGTAR